jgi:hypothetical protein
MSVVDLAQNPVPVTLTTHDLAIDIVQLAAVLRRFIEQGSQRFTIDPTELTIISDGAILNIANWTWDNIFAHGTLFIDAILFLGLNAADRTRATISPVDGANVIQPFTARVIGDALFFQWFMIITRGAPSRDNNNTVGSSVPRILSGVMGLNEAPLTYAGRLASFDLGKLNPGWVRHVPFTNIGREVISRYSLGVAGYRVLSALKNLPAPDRTPVAPNLLLAYNVARSMATSAASWEIHSATRSANFTTLYGPINANVGNLLLELYLPATLQAAVTRRELYALPIRNNSYNQYANWSVLYVTPAGERMF